MKFPVSSTYLEVLADLLGSPSARGMLGRMANRVADLEKLPEIVVLCGSLRFADHFIEYNRRLTLEGKIVLSVGVMDTALSASTDVTKLKLDQLHFRKIELADMVLVLNVGGYIGESTANEVRHARHLKKRVEFIESTLTADSFDRLYSRLVSGPYNPARNAVRTPEGQTLTVEGSPESLLVEEPDVAAAGE